MIQSYNYTLPIANVPRAISLQGNFLEIVEATGTLTIVFSPGFTTTAKKGDVLRSDNFPIAFDGFQISSSVNNDVITIKAGKGFTLSLSWLREKLDAVIAAIVAIPASVTTTMMKYAANGLFYPLQTTNTQDLAVGGLLVIPGIYGAGSTINTKSVSFMRIIVQAAGNIGDYLTLIDGTDTTQPPLVIYDDKGQIARTDGRLYINTVQGETYSPVGKVYFVDVRGVGSVTLVAGIGTPAFSFSLAPLERLPVPTGARSVMLNAADMGIAVGPFPLGLAAGTIFTTSSLKATFTRLGIKPKRLNLTISFTPAGNDSFALSSRTSVNSVTGPRTQLNGSVAATAVLTKLQLTQRDAVNCSWQQNADATPGSVSVANTNLLPADDLLFMFEKATGVATGNINSVNLLLEE